MCVGMGREWKEGQSHICEKEEVWHIYFATVINWVERLITISRSLRLLINLNQRAQQRKSIDFLDDFLLIMLRFCHTQRVLKVWWSIINHHNLETLSSWCRVICVVSSSNKLSQRSVKLCKMSFLADVSYDPLRAKWNHPNFRSFSRS